MEPDRPLIPSQPTKGTRRCPTKSNRGCGKCKARRVSSEPPTPGGDDDPDCGRSNVMRFAHHAGSVQSLDFTVLGISCSCAGQRNMSDVKNLRSLVQRRSRVRTSTPRTLISVHMVSESLCSRMAQSSQVHRLIVRDIIRRTTTRQSNPWHMRWTMIQIHRWWEQQSKQVTLEPRPHQHAQSPHPE